MQGAMEVPAVFDLATANQSLRAGLRVWDALLYQVRTGGYAECQHALSVLRHVYRFLEQELGERLQEEERHLYSAIERTRPQFRKNVVLFRHEHDIIRRAIRTFEAALVEFNSTGSSSALLMAGEELGAALRRHMDREERLLPLFLRKPPG